MSWTFCGNSDDVEPQLEAWSRDVADVRIHGTTAEPPIERFQAQEGKALKSIDGIGPFHAEHELVRVAATSSSCCRRTSS